MERKGYSDSPSVKIVLSGQEHYKINGHYYALGLKRFLIIDNNSETHINIDATKKVEGVCIFPNKDLLNEVAQARQVSAEALLDNPFDQDVINIIHNQFSYSENRTGKLLMEQLPSITQLNQANKEDFDFEQFYLRLAESMIDDQLELEGKLKNIASVRKATKEELYRRIATARDFVEDNFTQKISLDDLAQEAFLSKYHFTRTFKSFFQLSPYQYLLKLRLHKAKELLSLNYSYNEVSHLIGFSDGKNLRKAIKKMDTFQ